MITHLSLQKRPDALTNKNSDTVACQRSHTGSHYLQRKSNKRSTHHKTFLSRIFKEAAYNPKPPKQELTGNRKGNLFQVQQSKHLQIAAHRLVKTACTSKMSQPNGSYVYTNSSTKVGSVLLARPKFRHRFRVSNGGSGRVSANRRAIREPTHKVWFQSPNSTGKKHVGSICQLDF